MLGARARHEPCVYRRGPALIDRANVDKKIGECVCEHRIHFCLVINLPCNPTQRPKVADAGRAIKLSAESIAALSLRGRAYYLLGEHEMAMNHWRQALKFDPEHPEVILELHL